VRCDITRPSKKQGAQSKMFKVWWDIANYSNFSSERIFKIGQRLIKLQSYQI